MDEYQHLRESSDQANVATQSHYPTDMDYRRWVAMFFGVDTLARFDEVAARLKLPSYPVEEWAITI